jgi:hypothetical protein
MCIGEIGERAVARGRPLCLDAEGTLSLVYAGSAEPAFGKMKAMVAGAEIVRRELKAPSRASRAS